MKCLAVIDTNILVSAIISSNNDSPVVVVINRIFDGEIIPVWSRDIIAEYTEVLHRAKFKLDESTIKKYMDVIMKKGIEVNPNSTSVILPDMKDLPFYEVVMEKRSDNAYLVTGNIKHFPKEPFIVTARQMLDILDGKDISQN